MTISSSSFRHQLPWRRGRLGRRGRRGLGRRGKSHVFLVLLQKSKIANRWKLNCMRKTLCIYTLMFFYDDTWSYSFTSIVCCRYKYRSVFLALTSAHYIYLYILALILGMHLLFFLEVVFSFAFLFFFFWSIRPSLVIFFFPLLKKQQKTVIVM